MSELAWEKSQKTADLLKPSNSFERYKFLIGGILMLAAVLYLIITGTTSGAQYFMTVDSLLQNPEEYLGKSVRISGAVIGDSIVYDDENLIIDFTVVHIPQETGDLAQTLHNAVVNALESPGSVTTLAVHYEDVKPDLLQDEVQAILTGELSQREDGSYSFNSGELLLKCPSRYEEAAPKQVESVENQ